ncbi:hypothetical protein CHUAL_009466 [Chamberlinius hualienensis]
MSAKPVKGSRLEHEVEKNRDESNWKKVRELAEQLKLRQPGGVETLANFLVGESKLELYLEDNPPTEHNVTKARSTLTEAKRYLLSVLNDNNCKQLGVLHEAYLLLGKLHFAMGMYEEALNNIRSSGLDSISDKSTGHRSLKIFAESFAIRGLCYEKIPPQTTSKSKLAEREEQVITCFEQAGDLALMYLQERDRVLGQSTLSIVSSTPGSTSPMPSSDESRIGPILETALQRAPILLIKNGKLSRAVAQYRNVMTAVETSTTQSMRLTLARQLAEVLLRGVSEAAYEMPGLFQDLSHKSVTSGRLPSASDSPFKPKKYVGPNLFCPKDLNEESILLLLICEAMAVREAVLSRSLEHREARIHSFHNATAVYDLLAIALVRRGQVGNLCEVFDRAMKFSFEEFHVWFQFGLSLASAGKHSRAILVFKECSRLETTNAMPSLISAKIQYEHLENIEEGLALAQEALEREKSHPQNMAARCHLAVGLGYFLKAEQTYLQSERQELFLKAQSAFLKSQQLDPNDYLAEFYLALYYSQIRQITEAIHHVKLALYLRHEHVNSLLLLILLLSAQKQYDEALHLIEAAEEEYPENFNLLYIKAHLEEHCCGGEEALLTSKHMLKLWRTTYEEQTQRDSGTLEKDRHRGGGGPSVYQLYSSELSDRDSSSLRANSVAASMVEHALSEVASSMSSYHPRPGPQKAWLLQIQIWLLISRLYLKLEQFSEAHACIQEAANIFPLSHHIMFMRGLIYEYKHNFAESKKWYNNAVAINPTHVRSLQHLGLVLHYLGSNHLAEKILRDAVKIDPLSHKSWYNMGKVLEAMSDYETASNCLATAIDLEASCPILPFSTIPRCLE